MSLRSIHLVFIAASIVLTLFVTLWGTGMYMSEGGNWGHLAFGLGSLGAGVGLTAYLAFFIRKTRQIGMH